MKLHRNDNKQRLSLFLYVTVFFSFLRLIEYTTIEIRKTQVTHDDPKKL